MRNQRLRVYMAVGNSLESLVPDPATLPRKQQQIADVLLSRPEVFAFGNLRTIEQLLDVSGITIIRFAKRLGFSGFQALQAAVRSNYLTRAGFAPIDETTESLRAGTHLITATAEQQRKNLDAMLSAMHEEDLLRAAQTIIEARHTFAFGTGSAGIVARLLVRLLRHVGLHGEYVGHAGVDEVIQLHDLNSNDVVVVVSLWLNFAEAARTLRLAKRFNAKTIVVVGGNASTLASMADQSLYAPGQGTALSFSLTASIALIECLIAAIASQRPEEVEAIQRQLHALYVEEDLIASLEGVPDPRHAKKKR